MEAWIEICRISLPYRCMSRLRIEAWIEIMWYPRRLAVIWITLRARAWIEMAACRICMMATLVAFGWR